MSLGTEAVEIIVGVGERVVVVVVVVAVTAAVVVVVGAVAVVVVIVTTGVVGTVERMDGVGVLVITLGVLAVREAGAAALDSLPIEISLSENYYL